MEFNVPPLVLIGVAIICFSIAKYLQRKTERLKQVCTEEAQSRLTHYEEYETLNDEDDTISGYYEVYSFTADGLKHEAKLVGKKDEKPVGLEEIVMYNPYNPKEYYFKNKKLRKNSGAPLLWLGMLFLALSLMTTLLTWQL